MKKTRTITALAVWAGLAIYDLGFLEPEFRQPLELLSTFARSLSLTEYSTGQFMMKLRPVDIILFVVSLVLSGSGVAQGSSSKGRVMSWVPPYATEACRKNLDLSFDGVGVKDGLTHLGLQFWVPTQDGGLKFVDRFKTIDDATVSSFQKWGEANGVKAMLCVYNTSAKGWDWELARSAFGKHRERLVQALVSEALRLELDGVDIDFEGKGSRGRGPGGLRQIYQGTVKAASCGRQGAHDRYIRLQMARPESGGGGWSFCLTSMVCM